MSEIKRVYHIQCLVGIPCNRALTGTTRNEATNLDAIKRDCAVDNVFAGGNIVSLPFCTIYSVCSQRASMVHMSPVLSSDAPTSAVYEMWLRLVSVPSWPGPSPRKPAAR